MLNGGIKGKEARRYFLEVERKLKVLTPQPITLPKSYSEALEFLIKEVKEKELLLEANNEKETLIAIQAPKVLFADAIGGASTNIGIAEMAKILNQNGVNVGQNRLFQYLRDNEYLIKRDGSSYNSPTQRAMNMGLFSIMEHPIVRTETTEIKLTTKVTPKGQSYFINKFLKAKELLQIP